MITGPTQTFTRRFRGYDCSAVDSHIEVLTTKQQYLLDDVENLRAKLNDSNDEADALRKEVARLADTSSAPHAVQQRMADLMRRAVDDAAELRADAQAEASALTAAADAEIRLAQQKHEDALADLTAQKEALLADYDETKKALEAEMADARADAEEQRAQLLADAKLEANHYRDKAIAAVDEASKQRLKVLEQLMGVYRDLAAVPAALESAYQEIKDPETSPVDGDDQDG